MRLKKKKKDFGVVHNVVYTTYTITFTQKNIIARLNVYIFRDMEQPTPHKLLRFPVLLPRINQCCEPLSFPRFETPLIYRLTAKIFVDAYLINLTVKNVN